MDGCLSEESVVSLFHIHSPFLSLTFIFLSYLAFVAVSPSERRFDHSEVNHKASQPTDTQRHGSLSCPLVLTVFCPPLVDPGHT